MALFPVRGIDHFCGDSGLATAEAAFTALLRSLISFERHEARSFEVTAPWDDWLSAFRDEFCRSRPQSWGVRILLKDRSSLDQVWYFRARSGPFPTVNAFMTTESPRRAGVLAAKSAVSEDLDRAYWQSGWGYFGATDTVYFAIKRRALVGVLGDTPCSAEQIAAGIELRTICRSLIERQDTTRTAIRTSSWFSGDRRFAHKVDSELAKYAGKKRIQALVESLGVSYSDWAI